MRARLLPGRLRSVMNTPANVLASPLTAAARPSLIVGNQSRDAKL